jgi:RND family efflux transporter MFP subunit
MVSAQASLTAAQARLAQVLSGPQAADLASAQASIEIAETNVEQARNNVDKATLRAPVDGIVTAVNIKPGDAGPTSAGTPSTTTTTTTSGAITVLSPTGLYLNASVTETDLPNLRQGQPARVTMDSLPGRNFTGQVASISYSPTITQGVVTYAVWVTLQNVPSDVSLGTGMSGTATIVTNSKPNVLFVPSRSIVRQGQNQVVYVYADGKQEARVVRTGISSADTTEILEGLQEGELVVNTPPRATGTQTPGGFGGPAGGGGPGGGGAPGGGGQAGGATR